MPKNSSRSRSSRSDDWGVTELVRERPIAAAAAAAGAAAAGLFLWSRRAQISQQLSNLSDQIGEWTEEMVGDGGVNTPDDTGGLTTTGSTGTGKMGRPRTDTGRSTSSRSRGMSETGGGNASLGAHSGGGGTTIRSASRGRSRAIPSTT